MTSYLAVIAGVAALDFLTKAIVRHFLILGQEIPLLPFFSLVHVENTGVAFGLFQNRNALLAGLGLLLAAGLAVYGARMLRHDRISGLALAGVVGGAVGNLIDRVWFGRVTDFLDFFVGSLHWPAFNVADSAICVGAAVLLLRGWASGRARENG